MSRPTRTVRIYSLTAVDRRSDTFRGVANAFDLELTRESRRYLRWAYIAMRRRYNGPVRIDGARSVIFDMLMVWSMSETDPHWIPGRPEPS